MFKIDIDGVVSHGVTKEVNRYRIAASAAHSVESFAKYDFSRLRDKCAVAQNFCTLYHIKCKKDLPFSFCLIGIKITHQCHKDKLILYDDDIKV